MKKIILTISLLAFAFLASAQYVPGKPVLGNQNVYGNQWVKDTARIQYVIADSANIDTLTATYIKVDSLYFSYLGVLGSLPNVISDTVLVKSNDTIGWRVSIPGSDSVTFASYSDTATYALASGGGGSFDSTHCWGYLKTDSLVACGNELFYNARIYHFINDSIYRSNLIYINKATNNIFQGLYAGGLSTSAGDKVTTGTGNVNLGFQSGYYYGFGAPTNNVGIGIYSMRYSTGGNNNVAVGAGTFQNVTGDNNIGLGPCGLGLTTGSNNIIAGNNSYPSLTTASNNIVMGNQAALAALNNSNSIIIGWFSGKYQTHGSRYIINNVGDMGNQVNDSINSFQYGIMNATSSASLLRLNTNLYVKHDTYLHDTYIKGLKSTVTQVMTIDSSGKFGAIPMGGSDITCVDAADYVVLSSDYLISDSTGAGNDTITLPTSPLDGDYYEVCKYVNAGSGNVVVDADGIFYTITSTDSCLGFTWVACRNRWQKKTL